MKTLIALLLSFGSVAHAEVDIDIGITKFHQAKDGIWIQEGFPHEKSLVSPSAAVAIVFRKNDPWSYRLGAAYIGKVTSSAKAVADAEYNMQTKKCDRKPIFDCYLTTYNGSGTVSGLTLSARRVYGNNFFVEPGLILERSTWQVDIPDMMNFRGTAYPTWHYHVEHKVKLLLLPTLAFGYRHKDVTLKLSAIPTVALGDEFCALYRGVSLNLSMGWRF